VEIPVLPDTLAASVPVAEYLDRLTAALGPHGFEPGNTQVALSICRDEMTQQLSHEVEMRWGPAFAIGGLGGFPSSGSTGWAACLSHVPDQGRGMLLAIGLAHIGVEPDGSTGTYHRPWMAGSAPTCGALGAILHSWHEELPGEDLSDHELHTLRTALEDAGGRPEDMLAATHVTARRILELLVDQISELEPWDRMDVAAFAGIQVHTPAGVGTGDRILHTGGGLLDARGLEEVDL
jgi:hypothetical protein